MIEAAMEAAISSLLMGGLKSALESRPTSLVQNNLGHRLSSVRRVGDHKGRPYSGDVVGVTLVVALFCAPRLTNGLPGEDEFFTAAFAGNDTAGSPSVRFNLAGNRFRTIWHTG